MMDHVENYEEAKRFLKNNMGGAWDKKFDKFIKIKAGFITALAAAIVAGVGILLMPLLFRQLLLDLL